MVKSRWIVAASISARSLTCLKPSPSGVVTITVACPQVGSWMSATIPRRLGSSTIISPTGLGVGVSSASSASVTQLLYLPRSLLILSRHYEGGGDDGGGTSLLTTGLGWRSCLPNYVLGPVVR